MRENLISRRQAMAWVATVIGVSAAQAQQVTGEKNAVGTETIHRTSLHQEIQVAATPIRIYGALLDSKQFASITGMPAEIEATPGGAFKLFGGLIEGRTIEIIPAQRLVQAWRPASWESGVYSVVHFEIKARGAETRLVLDHTGFPEGDYDHLYSGWYARYWNPMKKWLAGS